MASANLLLDEEPLVVLPGLAKKIGLNESIIVQQVHYWLKRKTAQERDGKKWVYNTYKEWAEQFPFWSEHTIQRIFIDLEKKNLLTSCMFNEKNGDRRKWYTLNYQTLLAIVEAEDTPSCQVGTIPPPSIQLGMTIDPTWHDHDANMARSLIGTETPTETTTENHDHAPISNENPPQSLPQPVTPQPQQSTYNHPAVQAYVQTFGKQAIRILDSALTVVLDISRTVGDNPNDLALWHCVLTYWRENNYRKDSIGKMRNCFSTWKQDLARIPDIYREQLPFLKVTNQTQSTSQDEIARLTDKIKELDRQFYTEQDREKRLVLGQQKQALQAKLSHLSR